MTHADEVRQYVLDEIIEPARRAGKRTARVKAGEIHKALGFSNRMPLVCGALDADKFLDFANVHLVNRSGPPQSSSVVWVFGLEPQSPARGAKDASSQDDRYSMIDAQYELSLQMADSYAHRVAEGKYNEATKLVAEGLSMLVVQNCQVIELLRRILKAADRLPE